MSNFNREEIEEIKKNINLPELIQSYGYACISSGNNRYKMKCPFSWHPNDNSPSLMIYTENKPHSFYCFGCNTGSDPLDFLMFLEGRSFSEVLRSFGLSSKGKATPADRILALLHGLKKRAVVQENTKPMIEAEMLGVGMKTRIALEKFPRKQKEIFRLLEKLDDSITLSNIGVEDIKKTFILFDNCLKRITHAKS